MSEDKVFEVVEKVRTSDNLMSFAGCPNRCRDGYYIDPYQHKRVRCEHCYELRKKLVQERIHSESGVDVSKILNLPPMFSGYGNLEIDSLFVQAELNKLESWSVDFVKSVLTALVERVSLGEAVIPSMLINIGRRAHTQSFIAPFLTRSYISGLTTSPYLNSLDAYNLRCVQVGDAPSGWYKRYKDIDFDAVVNAETCVLYLDAGAGSPAERELMAVKGLMQLRAWQGHGTIILTDYFSYEMFNLVEDVDILNGVSTNTVAQSADAVSRLIDGAIPASKDLAFYVGVKYKAGKDPKPGDVANRGPQDGSGIFASQGNVGVG